MFVLMQTKRGVPAYVCNNFSDLDDKKKKENDMLYINEMRIRCPKRCVYSFFYVSDLLKSLFFTLFYTMKSSKKKDMLSTLQSKAYCGRIVQVL